jgi:Flp pilus assembly protein TadD
MSDAEYAKLISLGKEALKEKEFKEAISFFEKAIALDEANPEAYVDLGNVFSAMEEIKISRHYFEKALELDISYWRAWNNIGIANHTFY